jgi:hypothetical protein
MITVTITVRITVNITVKITLKVCVKIAVHLDETPCEISTCVAALGRNMHLRLQDRSTDD